MHCYDPVSARLWMHRTIFTPLGAWSDGLLRYLGYADAADAAGEAAYA
jgi:hypothetical protein